MSNNLQLFFQDLQQRGIVANVANLDNFYQLELEPKKKVVYLGIDCTGERLHIGHLFLLIQTIRFAKEGFQILLVLGGATSKIGDPSDKNEERPLLAIEKIENYQAKIKAQIERILIKSKKREKNDLAPLEQFYAENPKLLNDIYQILGSFSPENKTFAFNFPLLADSSGKKISKSESGKQALWLDSEHKVFFDFFRNMPDEQAKIYIKQFTFLSESQINEALMAQWIERLFAEQEVGGSIPPKRAMLSTTKDKEVRKSKNYNYMPTLNLKNIAITQKEDKNLNPYYLIIDKDTNNAYFCFSGAVKSGWEDLTNNYESIHEVELEFETNERGNNKVTSLYAIKEEEIIA
ncbi:16922_t:CDS:2 [Cetraspora pellucida]|uniref:16922_t:CDS:1 n=2 Tax=Cetraspora pellucida TaxID=1433469 RepID=A0ACA9K040_9GLOM|nr:16917_t:CDS:2 [Cetraspora pellucida]CAG8444315.1 16922_t:CDS:2 [Cetraspora pellucida]